jgi:hypothetical protein
LARFFEHMPGDRLFMRIFGLPVGAGEVEGYVLAMIVGFRGDGDEGAFRLSGVRLNGRSKIELRWMQMSKCCFS